MLDMSIPTREASVHSILISEVKDIKRCFTGIEGISF
jgi:hypothetical protein